MKTINFVDEKIRVAFKDIRISDIHECEFHLVQLEKFCCSLLEENTREVMKSTLDKAIKEVEGNYNSHYSTNQLVTYIISELKEMKEDVEYEEAFANGDLASEFK